MMREFTERMKVIRACPIKIFAGGKGGQMSRFWYPYKLQKKTQIDGDILDRCMEFMLDSAIGEDEVTNREVLETAIEMDAEYVIPKDYLWEPEKTYESICEFIDLWKYSDFRGRVLLPLQPSAEGETDHWKMYNDLICSRALTDDFSMFVIGGVKDVGAEKQIEALERFWDVRPPQAYVHGLGMGGSIEFVRAIRQQPGLCDAVDLSTPIQALNDGAVMGKLCNREKIGIPNGTDTTTVQAQFMSAIFVMLNHIYSPLCTDEEVRGIAEDVDEEQADLVEALAQ